MAFPPKEQLPTGPLSFAYHLVYDEDISNEFSQNPTKVMDYFQLSSKIQDAVQQAGDAGEPDDELIMQFLAFILPIFKDPKVYLGKW